MEYLLESPDKKHNRRSTEMVERIKNNKNASSALVPLENALNNLKEIKLSPSAATTRKLPIVTFASDITQHSGRPMIVKKKKAFEQFRLFADKQRHQRHTKLKARKLKIPKF